LANSIQAKKRIRQNAKRRLQNSSKRSSMRTLLKRVLAAIKDKNKELATKELSLASSILDKLVKKGIIHKNKANRHKSRLCLKINSLS
jgi:small subunit ribosomal protein S20